MAQLPTYSSLTLNEWTLNAIVNNPPADAGMKWLFDALGFSKGLINVGAKAAAIATGIGTVVAGVDTAFKIGQMVGLGKKEPSLTEIMDAVEALNGRMQQIIDAVAAVGDDVRAAWAAERAIQLTNTLAMMKSALRSVEHVLSTRRADDGDDGLRQQMLATAEAKSGEALARLASFDSAYWKRPAFDNLVRLSEWHYMTPRPASRD